MKKINITLFPVPTHFGMMKSPQIDIAQLYGDLVHAFGRDISMNDYRFSSHFQKEDVTPQILNEELGDLMRLIREDSFELIRDKYSDFLEYFGTKIRDNDVFIFPISILEQFHLEYLAPVLLFSYWIKKLHKQKQVIIFGNYSIVHAKKIAETYPFIDAVIVQGDNLSVIDLIQGKSTLNTITRDSGGTPKIHEISHGVRVNNFSLPCFEGFNLDFYRQGGGLVLPYELSRGCKNHCFFCYYIHKGRIYSKDIHKVIRELSQLQSIYGTDRFHFHDAEINFDTEYLHHLCDSIIAAPMKFFWSALAIPKDLNKNLLQKLYDAGCRQLRFGIESGSQRILDIIGKGTNISEIEEILKNCKEIGISTYGTFIVDLPQETITDITLTMDFIQRNRKNLNDVQICSYGELGTFPVEYIDKEYTTGPTYHSKKKQLLETLQKKLHIGKGDIVEFIRNA